MGLFALADLLNREGFPTTLIHTEVEETTGDSLPELLAVKPLIAGISCHWVSQAVTSLKTAELVKSVDRETFVVLGGFTASFFARDILEACPSVDAVVRGDGEAPLLALAKALSEPPGRMPSLAEVPNLAWRRNGEIVCNPCSYVADTDDLDALEFGNLNLMRHLPVYQELSGLLPLAGADSGLTRVFYLCVGRGCPASCVFCGGGRGAQLAINNRRRIAWRSPSRTLETIRMAAAQGYRTIYVSFDPDPSRRYYSDLFQRIRSEGLPLNMVFGCWSLPGRDFIDDFRRTFPHGVFEISPETGSERVRRENKDFAFTNEELEQAVRYIGDCGLRCHLYFSYFHMNETADDIQSTRRYYWDLLHRFGRFTKAYYLALSTDPCSPIYLTPEEHRVSLGVTSFSDYLELVGRGSMGNFRAHRPVTVSPEEAAGAEDRISGDVFLTTMFQNSIQALLRRFGTAAFLGLLDDFYKDYYGRGGRRDTPAALHSLGCEFVRFALAWLERHSCSGSFFADLLIYERRLCEMRWELYAHGTTSTTQSDGEPQGAGKTGAAEVLKPRIRGGVKIQTLRHDVLQLIAQLNSSDGLTKPEQAENTLLLHFKQGTLCTTRINKTMEILLRCCCGGRTVEEVAASFQGQLNLPPQFSGRILDDTVAAVRQLNEMGILDVA